MKRKYKLIIGGLNFTYTPVQWFTYESLYI
jgi:hypothetical protein